MQCRPLSVTIFPAHVNSSMSTLMRPSLELVLLVSSSLICACQYTHLLSDIYIYIYVCMLYICI